MPRFKLTIEYAGTRYSGWQIQTNARTVQGEIDRAVREVTGERDFELYGSGRTDAGVHALAQVAHLDVHTTLPPETLRRRINDALPSDINVLRIEKVRHGSTRGTTPSARSYIYQVVEAPDRVRQAVRLVGQGGSRHRSACAKPRRVFVGIHDFRSFSDDDPDDKSTEVRVDGLDIHEDGDLIVLHIEGIVTSSGRWSGASSACSWRSVAAGLTVAEVAAHADGTIGRAGAPDRAGLGPLSRARVLRRRPARRAGASRGDCDKVAVTPVVHASRFSLLGSCSGSVRGSGPA